MLAAWAWLFLGLGKRVPGLMSLSSDQATRWLTPDSSAASALLPHHRLSLPVPALQQLGLAGPSSAGPMGSLLLLWEESLVITGGREGGGRAEAPHHAFPHPCQDCLPSMNAQYGPLKLPRYWFNCPQTLFLGD